MTIIKIDPNVLKGLSDNEIRDYCIKSPNVFNGEYLTSICKQCGTYQISPQGSTVTCEIKDKCSKCSY